MRREITIYKADTDEVRLKTHIGVGSVAKYTIGREDSITLKIVSPTPVDFAYGDYIDINEQVSQPEGLAVDLAMEFGKEVERYAYDEKLRQLLCGRYEVVSISLPTYNTTTGGYEYQLRLDAWYMKFGHYLLMMPYIHTDGNITRRETSWSLTDKLARHLALVILNLKAVGINITARIDYKRVGLKVSYANVTCDGGEITITEGTETLPGTLPERYAEEYIADDTKFISYDKQNIIQAITTMANEWQCDWWMDGNVLRFGRRESEKATSVSIGKEATTITSSNASKDFATRLYVFGGTRNVPPTYRKKLIFESSADGTDIKDETRKVLPNMFNTRLSVGAAANIVSTGKLYTQKDGYMWGEWIPFFDSSDYTLIKGKERGLIAPLALEPTEKEAVLGYSATEYNGDKLLQVQNGDVVTVTISMLSSIAGRTSLSNYPSAPIDKVDVHLRYTSGTEDVHTESITEYDKMYEYSKASDHIYCRAFKSKTFSFVNRSYGFLGIRLTTDVPALLQYQITFEVKSNINKATSTITYEDGTTDSAVINPRGVSQYDDNASIVQVTQSKSQGSKYTMSNLIWSKVPASYYQDEEQSAVFNSVAENRLRMPNLDYVDIPIGRELERNEIIEGVVILDDVYPHRDDKVTDVKTYTYQEKITDEVTGQERDEDWDAYIIKSELFSNDFSNDYKIDGEDLKISFKTGLLAGMEFTIEFNKTHGAEIQQPELLPDGTRNPEACWFEIIKNEDYGIRMPNDLLKPSVGDEFTIYGYDTSYMAEQLTRDAEEELHRRALLEADKQVHNQSTYDVVMMPSWLEQSEKWFGIGEQLEMDTPNYFVPHRKERIIGYEVKMDIPVDHPKFTCGESPAYSRLKSIEEKFTLQKQSK